MRVKAVVLLLLVSGCAPVTERTGTAIPSPASSIEALPSDLGSFRRVDPFIDYERQPGGSGLGASVRYVPRNGQKARATVYVYDRGQRRGPEGAGSPDVAEELRAVHAELNVAVRVRMYRAVMPDAPLTLRTSDGVELARCATFRVVQANGAVTSDAACLGIQHGRFLKVRFTAEDAPDPAAAGLAAAKLTSEVWRAQAERAADPANTPTLGQSKADVTGMP